MLFYNFIYLFSSILSNSTSASSNDRILVIRGSLDSICQAELNLSEQIRWAVVESLIPANLWPILNCLHPIQIYGHRLQHPIQLYDPHIISSLILSMANVFWPKSVSTKLHRLTATGRQSLQAKHLQTPIQTGKEEIPNNQTQSSSTAEVRSKIESTVFVEEESNDDVDDEDLSIGLKKFSRDGLDTNDRIMDDQNVDLGHIDDDDEVENQEDGRELLDVRLNDKEDVEDRLSNENEKLENGNLNEVLI